MADVFQNILRKQLDKIAKEHNYDNYEIKITALCTDGANYTSKTFQATILAPNREDLKLFAKVASIGQSFREQLHTPIFEIENYTYSTLAKIYEKIEDKYQVPDEHKFRMPKFYGYDDTYLEETLVIEDLSARGFTAYERMECLNSEHAAKTLEELAKWHALSIVCQEDYPKEFEEATKVYQIPHFDENVSKAMVQQVVTSTLDSIIDETHRERLRKFAENQSLKQFLEPMKRPMLGHGDFRMSNILHKTQNRDTDVIIIDYQTVNHGCGVKDVLYFLLTGTDQEFRAKNFYPLLEHYYDQLGKVLRRMNRELEVVYPRVDFDYEVEKHLPWGLIMCMFALPLVTVTSEDAPSTEDISVDKMTNVQKSSLYESRMNGIIRDFVEWGVI